MLVDRCNGSDFRLRHNQGGGSSPERYPHDEWEHEWGPEMVWQPDADDDDLLPRGRRPAAPSGNWEVQYDIGSINGKALASISTRNNLLTRVAC